MNRVVLLLAATTLTFTATAIYFAHALGVERARHSRLEVQSTRTGRKDQQAEAGFASPTEVGDAPDATSAGQRQDGANDVVARQQLAKLRDPARRAIRKEQSIESLRGAYSDHARGLGLSREELGRLVEALAERILERAQRRLECQLDPACDEKTLPQASSRQDMADLLGPEMYARYREFSESALDRGQVADMRRQLSTPNELSDAQAERLITALSAERRKFATETEQNGLELQARIIGPGSGIFLQSASTRGAADPFAERMESATRYNQRILSLASTVLTAGQLAEFKVMQDNKLQEYEELLREEAIRESVRKAMNIEP